MPIRHDIVGNVLRVAIEGAPTAEELAAGFARAFADPAFVKGSRLLLDTRGAAPTRPADSIRGLVARLAARGDRLDAKVALVVAEPAQFGLGRMTASLAEPHGIHLGLFRDPDEALAWLCSDA